MRNKPKSDTQIELPLILQPIAKVDRGGGKLTNEERFNRFHKANPHVYQAIVRLVSRARAMRVKRWSMKGIFEVLRWQWLEQTNGSEGDYKLNNTFTRFYSELLINNDERLVGFFELRKRK